jgi:hypothetical protein
VLTNNSELAREKMWARIYLIPALQAEEDRDQVRRHLADKAREKELLGTETKVYNSDRCVTGNNVVGRQAANHLITDSFDLPLRSHPNTRRSRSDTLYWACTYKYRDGGVSKPTLAIPHILVTKINNFLCVHISLSKQGEETLRRFPYLLYGLAIRSIIAHLGTITPGDAVIRIQPTYTHFSAWMALVC